MLLLIIIVAIAAVLLVGTIISQRKNINDLKEEADSYKTVADQLEILYEDLQKKIQEEACDYRIIHAEYGTSESDTMKYKTENAMGTAVKSRLSMLIANDIKRIAEPKVIPLGNGQKKYSYVIKVKVL